MSDQHMLARIAACACCVPMLIKHPTEAACNNHCTGDIHTHTHIHTRSFTHTHCPSPAFSHSLWIQMLNLLRDFPNTLCQHHLVLLGLITQTTTLLHQLLLLEFHQLDTLHTHTHRCTASAYTDTRERFEMCTCAMRRSRLANAYRVSSGVTFASCCIFSCSFLASYSLTRAIRRTCSSRSSANSLSCHIMQHTATSMSNSTSHSTSH